MILPPRKPEYLSLLDTRLIDEFADTHALLANFRFWSNLLGREVVVPAGFLTDFASVPRIVGAYLLFGGKGRRAAVIHDYLYSVGKLDPTNWPRKLCDDVFAEALAASGYSMAVRGPMWLAVRVGGGAYFNAPNVPQKPHIEAVMGAAAMTAP